TTFSRSRSHVALLYASAYPDRVEGLILVSTPASRKGRPSPWGVDLAAENWERFVHTLAGLTSPGDADSVDRLRQSTTQQDWLARGRASSNSDATELMGGIHVPVLVMHPRDYRVFGLEESRRLAAAIPGAN